MKTYYQELVLAQSVLVDKEPLTDLMMVYA